MRTRGHRGSLGRGVKYFLKQLDRILRVSHTAREIDAVTITVPADIWIDAAGVLSLERVLTI
jgi:hypothetical protein